MRERKRQIARMGQTEIKRQIERKSEGERVGEILHFHLHLLTSLFPLRAVGPFSRSTSPSLSLSLFA